MKRFFKFFLYTLATLLILLVCFILGFLGYHNIRSDRIMAGAGEVAPTLTEQGFTFRDLNKNGRLDPYEDSRQTTDRRVDDLLGQMTLKEKAGLMFHTMISTSEDGSLLKRSSLSSPFSLLMATNPDLILRRRINHFNILQAVESEAMARWHNNVQQLAERTRLGIPITISSDPRHAFSNNPLAGLLAGSFSRWPEPIGLAATGDSALVAEFADMARREYMAVGIRTALHPMADLATEPRWGRINGTFGEDALLATKMLQAYIRGFQGDTLGIQSVACMTKHFSGGGPQKGGWDAHFSYGKDQVYPGNMFNYHLIPFEKGAFPVHTAQIMPYYGVPLGQTNEDVGFAFNKEIVTGLLRDRYGFDGVICTDWALLHDKRILGYTVMESTGWGVEDLSPSERVQKAIEAGVDQFGGEQSPELIVALVKSGKIPISRIDESVRRLLRDKFTLGLFDDPYVDAERAADIVGHQTFLEAGALAQRKSIVLLKNGDTYGSRALPLQGKPSIYIENIDPDVASRYGTVVEDIEQADVAILRLDAPFEPQGGLIGNMFHQGDLDFKGEEKARILNILETVPTIVDIFLDRPAVIPEIAEKSAGLLANFGAEDAALLDVVFGRFSPTGKLPFEMPSSMEAVYNQKEDVPFDSPNPLFRFGFGLTYEN